MNEPVMERKRQCTRLNQLTIKFVMGVVERIRSFMVNCGKPTPSLMSNFVHGDSSRTSYQLLKI